MLNLILNFQLTDRVSNVEDCTEERCVVQRCVLEAKEWVIDERRLRPLIVDT